MTRTICTSSSSSSTCSSVVEDGADYKQQQRRQSEKRSCRQNNINEPIKMSCEQQGKLCDELVNEYRKFSKDFDHQSQDSFSGEQLNEFCQDFLAKCRSQHQCFAAASSTIAFSIEEGAALKFPNCSNAEALNEDLKLVSGELGFSEPTDCARLLANLYRRLCQGYYLMITLRKSRHNKESDRWRAVEYGRYAIRYDPTNFEACYWYMIALGWQLDVTTSPRERTLVARTFHKTTEYCIELDPMDPLAYHLRGRYYYNVAGLSWIERTVAEKLLGASMKATYQEAEREFRRAHELKDDWLPGGLWIARCLHAQKRPLDEIKQWIDLSLSMECQEPSTELELRDLLELKSKLKLK